MNRRSSDDIKINVRDAAIYTECSEEITQYNLQTMCGISLVGTLGGLVLTVLALPPLHLLQLLSAYIGITVVFGLFYVLGRTVLPGHPRLVLGAYYALFFVLSGIAMYMGTVQSLANNATTFVVLEIVLPLLIIDKPYRLQAFFAVVCAAFCVITVQLKAPAVAKLDVTNCVSYYFISVFLLRRTVRTKLRDILLRRELQRQRDMDALTSLHNRSAFERSIAAYLQAQTDPALMLIMDVDNFKGINDTLGHVAGDMALQKVSEAMRSAFRKSDFISRLGGDEFVAFLPVVNRLETVTDKIAEMIHDIEQIQLDDAAECKLSISVGIARYPQDGRAFNELYKKADAALYCAKNRGKGQYAIYDAAMDTSQAEKDIATQEAAKASAP